MQAQKIVCILLLLTWAVFSAKAQKFVSLDNRWRMDHQGWSAIYKYITFFKDSVKIDGKYYYQSYDSVVNVLTPQGDYFRQEAGIVYHYRESNTPKERVIYNFNMTVGDSIVYSKNYRLKVVKIDSVTLLDGSKRKRWELSTRRFSRSLYWVEGIGGVDIETLRPHYAPLTDGTSDFSCYFYKNEALYSNPYHGGSNVGLSCSLNLADPVSTRDLQELKSLEVLQNLGDGELIYRLNESGNYTTRLFNAVGALLEQKAVSQGANRLTLAALPRGIYFLQVIDLNNFRQKTLKLIRQ